MFVYFMTIFKIRSISVVYCNIWKVNVCKYFHLTLPDIATTYTINFYMDLLSYENNGNNIMAYKITKHILKCNNIISFPFLSN